MSRRKTIAVTVVGIIVVVFGAFFFLKKDNNSTTENEPELIDARGEHISSGKVAKTVRLNSGYEMPTIGLSTQSMDDATAEEAVYMALKTGYRLIDTAQQYGNETGVGKGIQRAIKDGIVRREDIFISTRIMSNDYTSSLSKLQTNYIDLLLIQHKSEAEDKAAYRVLEEGVRAGKVHSIGVAGYYTKEAIDEVFSFATITPAVIQNENHIQYQNTKLQENASKFDIIIEAQNPLHGSDEVVKEIAKRHNKTETQILLHWQLQEGYVAIPNSSEQNQIEENFKIFDFELSGEEILKIRDLDKQIRYEN